MQWAQKPIERRYVMLYPTVLPNTQISALWVTVSSRTGLKLFAKNYPNFSSKMLDMEVILWEDISNMRWAQKLLLWRLLLCNSTTNWKNNSSLSLRMMQNGLCKYGEIWRNMDKFNTKKIAVRTISQSLSYFHQNKSFKKTIAASLRVLSSTTEMTNGTWNDI